MIVDDVTANWVIKHSMVVSSDSITYYRSSEPL